LELIVKENDLKAFEEDLWKDARKMSVGISKGKRTIRRYSDKKTPIKSELAFVRDLKQKVSFNVPEIVEFDDSFLSFEYIAGTRAFNLLVDLNRLYLAEGDSLYRTIGSKLNGILLEDLREFQNLFLESHFEMGEQKIYPAANKIEMLYGMLSSILSLESSPDDLKTICRIYEENSSLPFRDATPKNVVLNISRLFQKQFSDYNERLVRVRLMARSGELDEKIHPKRIFHIDFSGCCYHCPEADDWFALQQHEGSIWLQGAEGLDLESLSIADLCTLFVRFSRFGGRKLAYRLLNKSGHQIRFGLDNEGYYFRTLRQISDLLAGLKLIEQGRLSGLMSSLENASLIVPQEDYFHRWKRMEGNYYRDVFPN
jgi:hypothetical protein